MKFADSDRTPDNCPIAIVTWRDIRDVSNWTEDEEVRCCRKLLSIGWLLYDGPDPVEPEYDILIIAGTYDYEDERWADLTVFPRTVIKKVQYDSAKDSKVNSPEILFQGRDTPYPATGTGIALPPQRSEGINPETKETYT